jgi:hypothetical protein
MSEAASVVFVGASADEPVQLSGPPRRLAGQVRLRNPQALSLVLRDAGLSDLSGRLGELPARHGFAPVVLRPAEERAVPLVIALDPATPPGEYPVAIDLMGQVRPAVLNVSQSVALRLEPRQIVLINEAERPRHAQLVVTNEGNVPLRIDAIGDADLRDDVARVRDLRGVIAPLLDEIPRNLDDLVAVLLAVLPPQGPVVGRLSVRAVRPVELGPGRTSKIDLEIKVPPGLAANGRYRARIAVLTADLEFVIVSPGIAGGGEESRTTKVHVPRAVPRPRKGTATKHRKEGGRR